MVELPIPDEITKYEPKLVGNFTVRQTIFGGIALVGALLGYNALKNTVNINVLFAGIVIFAAPFAVLGWFKPYGMHFEKFVAAVFVNMVVSPTKRFFASNNAVGSLEKDKYALPDGAPASLVKAKAQEKKRDEKQLQRNMNACKKELFL